MMMMDSCPLELDSIRILGREKYIFPEFISPPVPDVVVKSAENGWGIGVCPANAGETPSTSKLQNVTLTNILLFIDSLLAPASAKINLLSRIPFLAVKTAPLYAHLACPPRSVTLFIFTPLPLLSVGSILKVTHP